MNMLQPVETYLVAGQWVQGSGEKFERVSPIDGSPLQLATLPGPHLLEQALAAAQAAQEKTAAMPVSDRQTALRKLSKALLAKADVLGDILVQETGCPVDQVLDLHIRSAAGLLSAYAEMLEDFAFTEVRPGMRGGEVMITHAPVGVVAGIVPWNVPLFLACIKLGAAIATGCPIILKPAPENLASMHQLSHLIADLAFPAGMVSVLTGDRDLGAALVADPRVAKVSFTGSTAAGRKVAVACAERFARCTLEMGGKSAAILLDDVNIERVWPQLLRATLQNNGQVCGAQTRLFIPLSRFDEIVADLAERFSGLKTADPRETGTDIGPMVHNGQKAKIASMMVKAEAAGIEVAAGGIKALGEKQGAFIPPTLYVAHEDDHEIVREEVFGPVIVALPYATEAEAVKRANASPYGLSGSVWGTDQERVLALAHGLETGTVGLATKRILDFGSPFGGTKASGLGRELGPEGLKAYLEQKSILAPDGFAPPNGGK